MKFLTLGFFLSIASSMALGVTPFELPWMNNGGAAAGTYRMSDHPHGIFVVETYFLGCPYCNDNAQNVDDLATKFSNDTRVQVLDVGIDRSDSQYQTWINRHHPNHPVLKDARRQLVEQLGTSGYPSTYVIDCKGNVVAQTSGEWGEDEKQTIENGVNQLVGQQCGDI
jgi:peroxiredoxin